MSNSALIAARKRLETVLRKYEIPTESEPSTVESNKDGVLHLSLIQSRLNWTTLAFTKYKPDPTQQPKRTSTTKGKWPNMKWLGKCTLELGPHVFENTKFYEAVRYELWDDIVKQAVEEDNGKGKRRGGSESNNKDESEAMEVDTTVQTTEVLDMEMDGSNTVEIKDTHEKEEIRLKYTDVAFELDEIPNERYLFPKETIIQVVDTEEGALNVYASFLLPIDQTNGDDFFDKPKDKILKHGSSVQLEYVQQVIEKNTREKEKNSPSTEKLYHPANIRLTLVNNEIANALRETVYSAEEVRICMENKIKSAPKKTFLKYDLSQDPTNKAEVQDLLKKATTVPELSTGPIKSEKKRNEILNAIKLGKRPRDEKFEAELPKHKQGGIKEDGLLRCSYCGTKSTNMWRPGPEGQGTLCNACGIQWKGKEILIDAPVISSEEEKRLLKERKEREKAAETLELERTEKENGKKWQKKAESVLVEAASKKTTSTLNHVVSHPAQQRKGKAVLVETANASNVNNNSVATGTSSNILVDNDSSKLVVPDAPFSPKKDAKKTVSNRAKGKGKAITPKPSKELSSVTTAAPLNNYTAPIPSSAVNHGPQHTSLQQPVPIKPAQQTAPVPVSLYSSQGIPLPTLSISFGTTFQFVHPNCGVTLVENFFTVQLLKDGVKESHINLSKAELADAEFEVVQEGSEGDISQQREVLRVNVKPQDRAVMVFGTQVKMEGIMIRFLEKLDPVTGGAVVKRILQRWLVTVPQST